MKVIKQLVCSFVLVLMLVGIASAGTLIKQTATQDLTAGALSVVSDYGNKARVYQVMIKASEAITETVTITFDSVTGSAYDAVLITSSLSAATSYVFRPDGDLMLDSGDAIKVACTNGNTTGIVYVTIQLEPLRR